MRAVARFAGRFVLCLGWLALLAMAVLVFVEKTGILTRIVRGQLATALGSLGPDVRVEDAVVRWFEPALELRGVQLGDDGDALRLETVRLTLRAFDGGGLRLATADVRGGHLRLSSALLERFREAWAGLSARSPRAPGGAETPDLSITHLDVDVDTERWGRLPIGTVDLILRRNAGNPPILTGRLIPSLASSSGTQGERGEIWITGQEYKPGEYGVIASAARLPLSTEYLPTGTDLDVLRPFAPQGKLTLRALGRFGLAPDFPPRASVRLSLTEGGLAVAQGRQKLAGLALELDASYAPPSTGDLLGVSAWNGRARLSGNLQETPFEACAVIGDRAGAGRAAKLWAHVPKIAITHDLVELAGSAPAVENIWEALGLSGEGEAWFALDCPAAWTPSEPLFDMAELGLEAGFSGAGGVTYRGFTSRHSGRRDQGFPLPIESVSGSVVYARDPARLRPVLVGLVDLAGDHGSGAIRASGLIGSHPVNAPPFLSGYGDNELDLHVATDHVAGDDRLRAALVGLSDAMPPASTWEPFDPRGGSLGIDLRLVRNVEMEYCAVDVRARLDGVSLKWKDLPVPVAQAHGNLEFVSDGTSERGLALALDANLATAESLRLAARFQTGAGAPAPNSSKALDELQSIAIDIHGASLTGADKQTLVAHLPDVGAVMDEVNAKGFADVAYRRRREVRAGPRLTEIEVTPREVQLTPKRFAVTTNAVRGRVIVTNVEADGSPAVTRARVTPIAGTWGADVQVAATAAFPEKILEVSGAGVDPSNRNLLGALADLLATPGDVRGLDLGALRVEGALDMTGRIDLAGTPDAAKPSFRAFLRDDSFQTAGTFRLDRLHGILEWVDSELRGERIDGLLAGTPVRLSNLSLSTAGGELRFETGLSALDVPIDAEHLRAFLDPKTIDALLHDLGWRGNVDVENARLTIRGPAQGDPRLEFEGTLTPSDMQIQLGLPVSIRSAVAEVRRLVYEGGRARAVVHIKDLFGRIADRDLAKAELLVTYVEPRLSIESLNGELEGGQVRSLGADAERPGTVFSIDLEEPFPYQLAIDLNGPQMAGMLRGLFVSNIATRGKLYTQLRLIGDTEHALRIQGTGSIQVRDSRLWSVPAFRALFSQLGFDDTAVFDTMAANLRIRDGVVWMDDIVVRSPLLQLVGKGSIDFDGTLHFDLEVRYAIVDSLGPIRRLLYAIQNELLTVEVRGDLARPRVSLNSPWTKLFSRKDAYRALPVPGFAPLPPRF